MVFLWYNCIVMVFLWYYFLQISLCYCIVRFSLCYGRWCASGTHVVGIVLWVLVCFRYLCSGHWCASGIRVVGIVFWALVCCRYSCSGHCVVGIGVLQVLNWYVLFIVLWVLMLFRYSVGMLRCSLCCGHWCASGTRTASQSKAFSPCRCVLLATAPLGRPVPPGRWR